MILQNEIQQAAILLMASSRLVVLTGAGVSKESNLPTFREKGEGIWANADPQVVASTWGFMRDPDTAWNWHEHLRLLANNVEPNPAHFALSDMEDLLPQVAVITQNIDDLHERAGSTDVLPIHGSLSRNKCFHSCQGDPTYVDWDDLEDYVPGKGVPHCPYCGGWVRPDVVWFGESLPEDLMTRAVSLLEAADVLLVIGTSGIIQPAARLPYLAKEHGAMIIDVNPNPGGITALTDVWLQAPAGEVMPQVVAAMRWLRSGADT